MTPLVYFLYFLCGFATSLFGFWLGWRCGRRGRPGPTFIVREYRPGCPVLTYTVPPDRRGFDASRLPT